MIRYYLLSLLIVMPIFSQVDQELSTSDTFFKKWYIGTNGLTSYNTKIMPLILFGNYQKGLEFSFGFQYSKDSTPIDSSTDYNFNNDGSYDIAYHDVVYDDFNSFNYSISLSALKYLGKKQEKRLNGVFSLGAGFSYSNDQKDETYYTLQESLDDINTKQYSSQETTTGYEISLGYKAELFLKENFSISVKTSINGSYSVTSLSSIRASYDSDGDMYDYDNDSNKTSKVNLNVSGVSWGINYYFKPKK